MHSASRLSSSGGVYAQTWRRLKAGAFEASFHGLWSLAGRKPGVSAVLEDRTVLCRPQRRVGTGRQGAAGQGVPLAVDTLGHLLSLVVKPADHLSPKAGPQKAF